MKRWTAQDIPSQRGRVALVTGASSGLGRHMARVLAERGGHIVLACRPSSRADEVARRIRGAELLPLDLADLASVHNGASELMRRHGTIDLLINNAGIMGTPYTRTTDGFEVQLATNHLGPAVLTWLLGPALRRSPHARVVTVSSSEHRRAGTDVERFDVTAQDYRSLQAYAASKLAALIFAFELNRRYAGTSVISVAAHPGVVYTRLMANTLRSHHRLLEPLGLLPVPGYTKPVRTGAAPVLYAATMPDVQGGQFYGPGPALEQASAIAYDPLLAQRLWERTAAVTGVTPDPDTTTTPARGER